MVKQYVMHSSKLNLPDLKIKKERGRQIIEEDLHVKNIISSHYLLDKNLIDLLKKNLKDDLKLRKYMESYKSGNIGGEMDVMSILKPMMNVVKDSKIINAMVDRVINLRREGVSGAFQLMSQEKEKKVKDLIMNMIKSSNEKARERIVSLSDGIADSLAGYNYVVNSGGPLDILKTTTIYFCPKCGSYLSSDKFVFVSCICGNEIDSIKRVDKISLDVFSPSFFQFIDKNVWLEQGVAEFFKDEGKCASLCGSYILGHSGVDHEIDNLVDFFKEHLRILIECKNTQSVTTEQIFTLSGKMIDIGCIKGYLITTAPSPDQRLLRLARAKNIKVVSNIFDNPKKKLGEVFGLFL